MFKIFEKVNQNARLGGNGLNGFRISGEEKRETVPLLNLGRHAL